MKTLSRLALVAIASVALTAPTMASGYIPIGPKIYTPRPPLVVPQPPIVTPQAPIITHQPDLITPQAPIVTPRPDLVTVTPGAYFDPGHESTPIDDGESETCFSADMFGRPFKNGEQCFVARTLSPLVNGYYLPDVTEIVPQPDLVTPQPDLITPQPDIVTPQPDIVTPQPDLVVPQPPTCKQLGLGHGGLGWHSC